LNGGPSGRTSTGAFNLQGYPTGSKRRFGDSIGIEVGQANDDAEANDPAPPTKTNKKRTLSTYGPDSHSDIVDQNVQIVPGRDERDSIESDEPPTESIPAIDNVEPKGEGKKNVASKSDNEPKVVAAPKDVPAKSIPGRSTASGVPAEPATKK